MLLCTILVPILAGAGCSVARLGRRRRRLSYAAVLLLTDLLGVLSILGGKSMRLFPLTEDLRLAFALDGLGKFFLAAALILYTLVCCYAFAYMELEEREEVFFAFYFASFGAMISVCMAANLVSLYLCFELATLTSMPMVLHERTVEAVSGALKYLFYSIGGALLGLLAVMCLCLYSANANAFAAGGFLDAGRAAGHEGLLRAAVFLGIVGFGAKAGMYPLHGWLPSAHPVAPAPASALLSGIVAKAGILAVIRLVYFSAGPDLLRGTWVQAAWMCLSMATVFMGSMMAWREKGLKKRLAYSTVSQLSYIMLGLSLLSPSGLRGALAHVAAHACSKAALFLCAGVFIYQLGKRNVSELRGLGRRMPVTMWCFLLSSLSLVGIPPMGGFVSKWFLASAALEEAPEAFSVLIPVLLLISALLTAGYLLPVAVDAFFPPRGEEPREGSAEPSGLMTVPMLLLCGGALAAGLFGSALARLLSSIVPV